MKVLDAWAIMAWLKAQQPGAERVRLLLEAAQRRELQLCMNIVNLGEVFYVSAKARDLKYAKTVLGSLRPVLTVVQASEPLVMAAALLKARHPISYADGFAAATAIQSSSPLVTGDPELKAMSASERKLKLEWIA